MAPTRKSRSVYKRFSSEVSPDKDVGNSKSSSRPRKKKLSDMLGPQWSKEDLERFYEAYRKHGRDWRKVAAALRDRTVEMVEALYNMNRAYLSLPEGISSVVGLIAMMTDHYNVLEGSDDGEETNNDRMDHRTTKKRKRGKVQLKEDIVNPRTGSSNDDCLSLLTKRRVDGSLPRAVGKRTPRVPVSYLYRKDNYSPSSKRARKLEVEGNDDDIAHGAALVLKAASQRGDSPQVSVCPFSRRTEHVKASPVESHERMSRVTKRSDVSEDEEWHEGSMESKGAENGDCTKNESSIMEIEGIGTVEVLRRGKKFYKKKEKFGGGEKKHFEDGGEACSGTEGGTDSTSKKKLNFEVSNTKVEHRGRKSQRKRHKKLFFGVVDIRLENADESTALDALQTLADLSLMMPTSALDSESFIGLEDDKPFVDEDDTTIHPGMTSADVRSDKVLGRKEKLNAASGADTKKHKLGKSSTMSDNSSKVKKQNVGNKAVKRKGKPTELKLMDSEAQVDSLIGEHMKDQDVNKEEKQLVKGKSTGQMSNLIDPKSSLSKGWKSGLARDRSAKPSESSFPYNKDLKGAEATIASATVASTAKQVNSATRQRSRRKSIVQRTMILTKTPDKISRKRSDKYAMRLPEKALSWKDKLSSCLSLPVARKWCIFEWFYSAIDYPWFAKREFVDYLNHVGLGHIPRLTRIEWSVIRSSLGKPRRFSENFLREERRKLERYRESVRRHYTELRTGVREGLPTDLARPLCVGQRVIAIHPKTREVHDGSVLTVDHEKCMIQFDRADIGVEFVMDIDCMPFNPLDNMPEALRRNRIFIDKYATISKDHQMEASVNFVGPILYGSHGLPVNAQTPTIDFLKQAKDASHAVSQARGAPPGGVNSQPLVFNQPSTVAHVQAREADIRALCELTRALDKKEALIMELRNMNNDMLEDQINGDGSVKETESFKKHYAMVLVQLKEAGSQASSALVHLRERNTYTSSLPPWLKSPANSSIPFGLLQDSQKYAPSNESECNVPDIVKNSRAKALAMVDTAIQAIASLKEGEDAFTKIREAFDRYNQTQCSDSRLLNIRYPEKVKVADPILKSQSNTGASESGQPSETKSLASSDKIESQVPAELIASCVATLLMLQTCTERQYPPADMAQIIDSAVSSLHPCSSQNLPIYREIEMSMGRLKTQILALVPTHI